MILAAVIGMAIIIVLITWTKIHPFLALTAGGIITGFLAGLGLETSIASFTGGFGSTIGGVGILIALGAVFGKILAETGGADRIVDTFLARASNRSLPWLMGLAGALIGLPMFFEVGLVLLVPIIILVARRSGLSLMRVAVPTLAGLSAMHALVPPHPGPLAAIGALNANLGLTLGFGVLVAIPTVIVAGPLLAGPIARWVSVPVPTLFSTDDAPAAADDAPRRRPSFAITLFSILLPVGLMLAAALADVIAPDSTAWWKSTLDVLGMPIIALGAAVIAGLTLLGRGAGFNRSRLSDVVGSSLPPVAGILLIVGAGGGFKQVLVDSHIADVIAQLVEGSSISVLVLAWLVAALIRVATGSATVATITAAGILQPLAADLSDPMLALLVLAIGSGSVFLSHVNDAGFWLIKEYFGLTIGQTLKSWSVLECVISLTGLAGVLIISIFV
ncbi:MAG: GntP family permease [Mycetocola sp.]